MDCRYNITLYLLLPQTTRNQNETLLVLKSSAPYYALLPMKSYKILKR